LIRAQGNLGLIGEIKRFGERIVMKDEIREKREKKMKNE
jgi:hypothetical protein